MSASIHDIDEEELYSNGLSKDRRFDEGPRRSRLIPPPPPREVGLFGPSNRRPGVSPVAEEIESERFEYASNPSPPNPFRMPGGTPWYHRPLPFRSLRRGEFDRFFPGVNRIGAGPVLLDGDDDGDGLTGSDSSADDLPLRFLDDDDDDDVLLRFRDLADRSIPLDDDDSSLDWFVDDNFDDLVSLHPRFRTPFLPIFSLPRTIPYPIPVFCRNWEMNFGPLIAELICVRDNVAMPRFLGTLEHFRLPKNSKSSCDFVRFLSEGNLIRGSPHVLMECFRDVQKKIPSNQSLTTKILRSMKMDVSGWRHGRSHCAPRAKGRRGMRTYRNGKFQTQSLYYMYGLERDQDRHKLLGAMKGRFLKLALVFRDLLEWVVHGPIRNHLQKFLSDIAISVLQSPDFRSSYASFVIGMDSQNRIPSHSKLVVCPLLHRLGLVLENLRPRLQESDTADFRSVLRLRLISETLLDQRENLRRLAVDDMMWVVAVVLNVRSTSGGKRVCEDFLRRFLRD